MPELIAVDVDGAVAIIRLQRPPMNVLNTDMQEQLRAAALDVGSRADVRAVVVHGGDRVFAAGADVKEFHGFSHAQMVARADALSSSVGVLARIPQPVVAAVTGFALGGGCELALTADRRISAEDAKWGQPEINLGLIPGAGGTQRLTRLVGVSRAKDLIYTGRTISATEALAIGLVDQVVPAADVYETALGWARQFAAGPALALRAAKAAIDGGLDGSLDSGLHLESHLFAGLFATEDRRIGMQAFVDRQPGPPDFVGR